MVDCQTSTGLRYKVYMDKEGAPIRSKFLIGENHEAWITVHKDRTWFHICEFKKTERGASFEKEKVGIFTLPGEKIGTFLETMTEMNVLAEEMRHSHSNAANIGKEPRGQKRKAEMAPPTSTDMPGHSAKKIKQQQFRTAGPSSKAP